MKLNCSCWLWSGILLWMTTTGCLHPQEKRRLYLRLAKTEMQNGRPEHALLRLRAAARIDGGDAALHYEIGRALLALDRGTEAYRSFESAIQKDPRHRAAREELSRMQAAHPDPAVRAEARRQVESLLQTDPRDALALAALAMLQLRDGEAVGAQQSLAQALELKPGLLREGLVLARLQLARNDRAGARATLAGLAKTGAASAAVAYAEFLQANREGAEAAKILREARSRHPQDRLVLLGLAMVEEKNGRFEEARSHYAELGRMDESQFSTALAEFHWRRGERGAAIDALRSRVARTNEDRAAERLLLRYLRTAGSEAEWKAAIHQALERNAGNLEARLERARMHASAGRWSEARQDAEAMLRNHPKQADAHFLLAQAARREGQTGQYRESLTAALQADARHIESRLDLVRSSPDARTARVLLDSAPEEQKNWLVWRIANNWWLVRERRWQALRGQLPAPGTKPVVSDFELQRAALHLASREFAAARTAVQPLLQARPGDLQALDFAVQAWMQEGRPADALRLVSQQAAGVQRKAPLLEYQARLVLALGRVEEARRLLEEALQLEPDFTLAAFQLAGIDSQRGRHGEALARFADLSRRDPLNVAYLLAWGDAHLRAGRPQEALAQYRRALEREPENPVALNNVAFLVSEHLGRADEALPIALKARDRGGALPAIESTLGMILARRGMWSAAVPHLERAMQGPPDPQSAYRLVIAYSRAGQSQKGRDLFRKTYAMAPALPEAAEARSAVGLSEGNW